MPPRYMATCAGVQKVSRPIVECHEMSQMAPTMMLVEPTARAYRYHGTALERSVGTGPTWSRDTAALDIETSLRGSLHYTKKVFDVSS